MDGLKIRELVAVDVGELRSRLRSSTAAARSEALQLTFGTRVGDSGETDLGGPAHEMRNVLTAALRALGIVAKETVGPETRAVATLRRNLLRMRVLVERGAPEVPGEA